METPAFSMNVIAVALDIVVRTILCEIRQTTYSTTRWTSNIINQTYPIAKSDVSGSISSSELRTRMSLND